MKLTTLITFLALATLVAGQVPPIRQQLQDFGFLVADNVAVVTSGDFNMTGRIDARVCPAGKINIDSRVVGQLIFVPQGSSVVQGWIMNPGGDIDPATLISGGCVSLPTASADDKSWPMSTVSSTPGTLVWMIFVTARNGDGIHVAYTTATNSVIKTSADYGRPTIEYARRVSGDDKGYIEISGKFALETPSIVPTPGTAVFSNRLGTETLPVLISEITGVIVVNLASVSERLQPGRSWVGTATVCVRGTCSSVESTFLP